MILSPVSQLLLLFLISANSTRKLEPRAWFRGQFVDGGYKSGLPGTLRSLKIREIEISRHLVLGGAPD